MTQRDALNTIHAGLMYGDSFGKISRYRYDHPDSPGGEYFSPVLYPIYRASKVAFIGYTHYGSSATKPTKKELDWIIRHIFNTTPSEFSKTYRARYHTTETRNEEHYRP